jgi:hypothetical protein
MEEKISNDDLSDKSFDEIMNEWLTKPISNLLPMFYRKEKVVDENP